MIKKSILIGIGLLVPSLSPAHSYNSYFTATVKRSFLNTNIVDDHTATAIRFGTGMKINSFFAFEVGFGEYGKTSINSSFESSSAAADGVDVSSRAFLDLKPGFRGFLSLGVVRWSITGERCLRLGCENLNQSGEDVIGGIGMLYEFSDEIDIGLEWSRFRMYGARGVNFVSTGFGVNLHYALD